MAAQDGHDVSCDRRLSSDDWDGARASDYVCPLCFRHFENGEFWIQCDACRDWFHGSCVFVREHESQEIEKFYCMKCEQEHGLSVMKPVTNDHRHDRTEEKADEKAVQAGSPRFINWIRNHCFPHLPQDLYQQIDGFSLSLQSLVLNGFRVPIIVEHPDGLGLKTPDKNISIQEVLSHFPNDYSLDVIDSRRQLTFKLPAEDFVRLVTRATEHESIYNCISLEVSKSELGRQIQPPDVVNRLSWVDNNWPEQSIGDKPYVSKYCLISMADSYTDFHVDFGGTSVWYHVLRGEKIFYVVEPTDDNLAKYEEWMQMKNHSEVFYGDLVPNCYRLHLREGNTLLLPTAWIHAVLTPCDSLVFGGNFLHSLNMKMQIRIHEMEQRMKTPAKFQFPFFELAHWYSASTMLKLLMESSSRNQSLPKDLLMGVSTLIDALKHWSTIETIAIEGEEPKSLVPSGFDCRRIIKDLGKALKVQKKLRKREVNGHKTPKSTEVSSDSERELVIAEESVIQRMKQKVTEEERKGVIKMKLSLCGKSGLPEVTEVAAGDSKPLSRKRKSRSSSIEDDPEIMDMIRDQPEDDDYIYLDVETAADEDEIRTTAPDHNWCPRAKVVIRGVPKEARPVREHARREFVETCLANAAAKMEHVMNVKKVTASRRKSRVSSGGNRRSSEERHSSSSPGPSTQKSEKRKTSPTPRGRKGEKTVKQRLAKLMKIGKRPF